MATCGSLRHIFESTIPENSSSSTSFIDSLSSSWKQIRPIKPPAEHSFTEIFGELHFKENPNPITSLPSQSPSLSQVINDRQQEDRWSDVSSYQVNEYAGAGSYHRRCESLPPLNLESLQLCTEGLGSESLDDVDDLKIELPGDWQNHNNQENNSNSNNYSHKIRNNYDMGDKVYVRGNSGEHYRKRKTDGRTFPPPISSIGRTGKPSVCFQSYRQDGRFVLKEIKIPTQECLHASREDGRLRLCFIQPADQDDDENDSAQVGDEEINGREEEGGEEKGVVDSMNEDGEGEEGEGGMEGREEETREEAEVRHEIEKGHS